MGFNSAFKGLIAINTVLSSGLEELTIAMVKIWADPSGRAV